MSRETIILHLLFDQIKKGHTNIFWNLEDRRAKDNHFFGRFSAKEGSNRADQARPSTHMQVGNIIISIQFKWQIQFFPPLDLCGTKRVCKITSFP